MHRRRLGWIVVVVSLVVVACGTRVDHAEVIAATSGGATRDAAGRVGARVSGNNPASASTASGAARPGDAGPTSTSPGAASDPSGNGSTATPSSGSPVVLGFIGTLSGIASVSGSADSLPGIQTWAAAVNARGGINGHPVELRVRDDGGDPVRGLQVARELVESEHVVAFVGNFQVSTMSAVEPYLRQAGIPVIGGDETTRVWFDSPVLFPQGGNVYGTVYAVVKTGISRNLHRFGLVYCGESEACTAGATDTRNSGAIADAGGSLVYEAQISLAQPDFTAECLGARNKNVDAILAYTDQASIGRFAASCARQGYNVKFVSSAVGDSILDDPNLDGFLQMVDSFPWAGLSTPAIDEFKQALATYAPRTAANYFTANAWSSGKVLERALRDAHGEITTQAILEGLYSLAGDDDLGLLPWKPSYPRDTGHPGGNCGFVLIADGGKWQVGQGGSPICGR